MICAEVVLLLLLPLLLFPFPLSGDEVNDDGDDELLCVPQCICLDTFFKCDGRALSNIPPNLPSWVTRLDLSSNNIQSLDPSILSSLTHLQSLSFDGNNLETIDSNCLNSLTSLTDLHLAKNKIQFIARDALAHLKHLERLDLSRNKLQTLDSLRFQELKKLQVLNLRRNPMTNLSDAAFYGLENIQHLYLEWGGIRVVEKRWLYGLGFLKTLNLSHNQIGLIEDEAFEFLEQLISLDLSWNQLESIGKNTLFGLSSLRTLDLKGNGIVGLDGDPFSWVTQLETLDLSENGLSWAIEDMPSPFRPLSYLTTLNLASNQIHFLHPDALKGLTSLKSLNLSSNPIAWLSEKSFVPVHPHSMILLSNIHSFLCDCESLWLQTRLAQAHAHMMTPPTLRVRHPLKDKANKKITNQEPPSPVCSHPSSLANQSLISISPGLLTCPDNSPKPMFIVEPLTQVFLLEGNGRLECQVQSYAATSLSIHWRKDHQKLPKHLEGGVSNRVESDEDLFTFFSSLEFSNVSWNEVGIYQCVALNDLGIVYSAKANITLHVFPSFVKKPTNVTVRLGSNAKLECGAKGFPMPEIGFQKDGGEDFPAALERRFHVMPNDDSFFIMEVKLADMGIYTCSAKNPAGQITANATVTVYETPSFIETMEDESVIEGSNAILSCLGGGSPLPLVTWTKEGGGSVFEGREKRIHLTENGSLLLIKNVEMGDGGRYECLLTNAVGTARGVTTLTVLNSGSVDNAAMTIIFIIIAVFCVVVTSAAWVVVIYRTRKRIKTNSNSYETAPIRHPKFEDFELATFPYNQTKVLICGDGENDSGSSGKDSGTGDDIQESLTLGDRDRIRVTPCGGTSLESFSTFGIQSSTLALARAPANTNNRIDLTHDPHPTLPLRGKGKCIPVPIPHVQVQVSLHSEYPIPTNSTSTPV